MSPSSCASLIAVTLGLAMTWPGGAAIESSTARFLGDRGELGDTSTIDTFVSARGHRLFDGEHPYQFRGFNLYNINGRGNCGYRIPDLGAELDDIGPAANVVRGWFFQRLATDPETGQPDWSVFDETLATLRQRGIRVIATLADQWGACEADEPRDRLTIDWYVNGYRNSPYSSDAPLSYRDWVGDVVSRYRDDPTILAWQLMNEAEAPLDVDGTCDEEAAAKALQDWTADIAGLIKEIDQNHLVSIGTIGGGQCGIRGPDYRTLHAIPSIDLCEHHDYREWQVVPDDLRYDLNVCRALQKPTFVGEVGLRSAAFRGNLEARAAAISHKLASGRRAGAVGFLVWAWRSEGDGGSSTTSFDVGPSDPLLRYLSTIPELPPVQPPRAVPR